jgi:hypothetical protein
VFLKTKLCGCSRAPEAGKRRSGEDIAKGLSHLILVRLVTGEPRRHLEHKISLHKAASEVRYIVIFNNGSPTEPSYVGLVYRHDAAYSAHVSTACRLTAIYTTMYQFHQQCGPKA